MLTPNPIYFAYNSEFDAIKNYAPYTLTGSTTVTGTISGTAPNNFATFSVAFVLDRTSTIVQIQAATTGDAGKTYILFPGFRFSRTNGGNPYAIDFSYVYGTNSLTVQALVSNPYSPSSLTLNVETITIYVKTFIAPFQA